MTARTRRFALVTLGLLAALALIGWFFRPSPPRYTVADLGTLPGYTASDAGDINSRGDVACSVTLPGQSIGRACIYHAGRLTDLGVLPGMSGSYAQGINSQDTVTGVAVLPNARQAFLYNKGKMQNLGTLPGFHESETVGINDRGEIAGNATNNFRQPGVSRERAFLYSHGKITALVVPSICSENHAASINAAGQIAGECLPNRKNPFLYDSRTKTMTMLAVPPPYKWSYVNHINDRGQIVGSIAASEIIHGALWSSSRMTDLGTPPGYTNSLAQGLNNRGEVVGMAWSLPGRLSQFVNDHPIRLKPLLPLFQQGVTQRAFIYRAGRMVDLNTLIPARSGWILEDARGINDRGQIAGQGLHHGQERGFLLTPR